MPDVDAAEETRGDSGKADVSPPKAMAAGAAVAAAGVAAASALGAKGESDQTDDVAVESAPPARAPVAETAEPYSSGVTTDRDEHGI